MTEIKIRFDLTFNRRFISRALVAAILFGAVPELESESVTLSTYYPAPSGVYTQMITTGNTYLARDGGNVGIGTPTPGSKLDVNGTANVSSNMTIGGNATVTGNATVNGTGLIAKYVGTGNNVFNVADPKAADIVIGSDSGTRHDSSIMMWSNASASRIFQQSDIFYLSVWNQNPVTGAKITLAAGTGDISAAGALKTTQGGVCGAPQTIAYPSPVGGTTPLCPGQYVTNVDGVYTKYYVLPVDLSKNFSPPINPVFNYKCCPCPTGGCTI